MEFTLVEDTKKTATNPMSHVRFFVKALSYRNFTQLYPAITSDLDNWLNEYDNGVDHLDRMGFHGRATPRSLSGIAKSECRGVAFCLARFVEMNMEGITGEDAIQDVIEEVYQCDDKWEPGFLESVSRSSIDMIPKKYLHLDYTSLCRQIEFDLPYAENRYQAHLCAIKRASNTSPLFSLSLYYNDKDDLVNYCWSYLYECYTQDGIFANAKQATQKRMLYRFDWDNNRFRATIPDPEEKFWFLGYTNRGAGLTRFAVTQVLRYFSQHPYLDNSSRWLMEKAKWILGILLLVGLIVAVVVGVAIIYWWYIKNLLFKFPGVAWSARMVGWFASRSSQSRIVRTWEPIILRNWPWWLNFTLCHNRVAIMTGEGVTATKLTIVHAVRHAFVAISTTSTCIGTVLSSLARLRMPSSSSKPGGPSVEHIYYQPVHEAVHNAVSLSNLALTELPMAILLRHASRNIAFAGDIVTAATVPRMESLQTDKGLLRDQLYSLSKNTKDLATYLDKYDVEVESILHNLELQLHSTLVKVNTIIDAHTDQPHRFWMTISSIADLIALTTLGLCIDEFPSLRLQYYGPCAAAGISSWMLHYWDESFIHYNYTSSGTKEVEFRFRISQLLDEWSYFFGTYADAVSRLLDMAEKGIKTANAVENHWSMVNVIRLRGKNTISKELLMLDRKPRLCAYFSFWTTPCEVSKSDQIEIINLMQLDGALNDTSQSLTVARLQFNAAQDILHEAHINMDKMWRSLRAFRFSGSSASSTKSDWLTMKSEVAGMKPLIVQPRIARRRLKDNYMRRDAKRLGNTKRGL
ncbi:hypothetical protein B0O99DRAFT_689922 [Bisporella sp. PMI_857]|nr:hypothetical protein B0O99DRAFT_689922 [Bisporella sp. PMI_857]